MQQEGFCAGGYRLKSSFWLKVGEQPLGSVWAQYRLHSPAGWGLGVPLPPPMERVKGGDDERHVLSRVPHCVPVPR